MGAVRTRGQRLHVYAPENKLQKLITTCNHFATLFTCPFSSHVCFLEMPDLWEDSEVMCLLEIWGNKDIQKQFEGSTPKKEIFEIISERLALVGYTDT